MSDEKKIGLRGITILVFFFILFAILILSTPDTSTLRKIPKQITDTITHHK